VGLVVRRASTGAPTALVGIDGALTSLSLDHSGDLVALRGPAGLTTKLTWQSGGLVTAETDPMGAVTHFRYGPGGLLVSETDPDGVTQQLRRSATSTSVEVRVTTGLGRVSTYYTELSGRGVRRSYIAPGGATTTETTQADGSFSLSLANGTTSTVGEVPRTGWGLSAPVLTPIVTTVAHGPTSRTEVDQDLGEVVGLAYTVTGTLTTTVNGDRWVESFDPGTRTTTVIDPAGRTTTNTYDSAGRLIVASTPGSPNATFAYNTKGRLVRETVGAGRLAETTRWAYNAQTGTVTVTRPDRSTVTESVDAAGNPVTIKGPNGAAVIEAHNADGLLTQLQPPGGATYTFGYSAAGRPTAFLDPSLSTGTSIDTATYDRDGDLKSVSGLGTKPVTLAYNAAGEVTGVSFDQGTATASYNPTTALLSAAKGPDGVSTTFDYSGGLPDRLSWSGPVRGSVTDNYDANGRPVSETIDGTAAIGFAYDGAGNLTTVGPLSLSRSPTTGLVTGSTLSAVRTAYRYNANDWLMGATTTVKGRTLMDLSYTRDALGRATSAVQEGPDGAKTTTDYTYNSADLLSKVIVNGRSVETDNDDNAGNRTSVTTPAGTTRATYNADNQLVRWAKASYSWAPDGSLTRLTDAAGTTSYSFDDLGELRHVTLPDGESVTYLVDAQGQRVGREVNGRLVAGYLYDSAGKVVAETNGADAVVARYGYDQLGHLALFRRERDHLPRRHRPKRQPPADRELEQRSGRRRDHLQRMGPGHKPDRTWNGPVRLRRRTRRPGHRSGPLRRPRLRPDDGPLDRARPNRLRRWRHRPLPLRGRRPHQQRRPDRPFQSATRGVVVRRGLLFQRSKRLLCSGKVQRRAEQQFVHRVYMQPARRLLCNWKLRRGAERQLVWGLYMRPARWERLCAGSLLCRAERQPSVVRGDILSRGQRQRPTRNVRGVLLIR
jgi:YD repeat-containing protein